MCEALSLFILTPKCPHYTRSLLLAGVARVISGHLMFTVILVVHYDVIGIRRGTLCNEFPCWLRASQLHIELFTRSLADPLHPTIYGVWAGIGKSSQPLDAEGNDTGFQWASPAGRGGTRARRAWLN